MKTAEERVGEIFDVLAISRRVENAQRARAVAEILRAYVRDCKRMRMEVDALEVQSFSPAPAPEPRSYGESTTPSACCDTGCTDPPC